MNDEVVVGVWRLVCAGGGAEEGGGANMESETWTRVTSGLVVKHHQITQEVHL